MEATRTMEATRKILRLKTAGKGRVLRVSAQLFAVHSHQILEPQNMLRIFAGSPGQGDLVSRLHALLRPPGSQHLRRRKDFRMPLCDSAILVLNGYRKDGMRIGPLVVGHYSHQRDAFALVYLARRMVCRQCAGKQEDANDRRDNNENLGFHLDTSKVRPCRISLHEEYHIQPPGSTRLPRSSHSPTTAQAR